MTVDLAAWADPTAVDDDWGRIPGLRPPLAAWAPLACFAVLAAVLTVVVVVLVRPPGPLDQPDAAYQRDGLLLDGPLVPPEVAGVEFAGRPVVLLFERDLPDPSALAQWLGEIPDRAAVEPMLPETAPRLLNHARLELVVDPGGRLADAVGLPTPVDRRGGIGYAIVDSDRRVRYSTLDPAYLANAFEVVTILGAVP